MKIAVIGAGISGLVAAYRLCSEHDITVFEANDYIGGHTNTVELECHGERHAIDTGFIVFNDWTYPHFIRLLDELGVTKAALLADPVLLGRVLGYHVVAGLVLKADVPGGRPMAPSGDACPTLRRNTANPCRGPARQPAKTLAATGNPS